MEFDKLKYDEHMSRLSELEPKYNEIVERLMPVLREYYMVRKEMGEILKILTEISENVESSDNGEQNVL